VRSNANIRVNVTAVCRLSISMYMLHCQRLALATHCVYMPCYYILTKPAASGSGILSVLGTAAAEALRLAVVSKNSAPCDRKMLQSPLQQQAPPKKAERRITAAGTELPYECCLPVVDHARKFGSQVRPAGRRYHCADRGDTGGHPAAQRRPAEDNGVWKLAGAGIGKVSRQQRGSMKDTMNTMLCIIQHNYLNFR